VIEELILTVFGFFCHQMPDRSPEIGTHVFPLCHRCSGLHAGILSASAVWFFGGGTALNVRSRRLMLLLATGFLPLLFDGAMKVVGGPDSSEALRAMSGLLAGTSLVALTAIVTRNVVPSEPTARLFLGLALAVATLAVTTSPLTYGIVAVMMIVATTHLLVRLLALIVRAVRPARGHSAYRSACPRQVAFRSRGRSGVRPPYRAAP
jgi:uncharacterized membrane protein